MNHFRNRYRNTQSSQAVFKHAPVFYNLWRSAHKLEIVIGGLLFLTVLCASTSLRARGLRRQDGPDLLNRSMMSSLQGSRHPRLAVILNMARRKDRWQRMYTHLNSNAGLQNLRIERLKAVDGRDSVDFAEMVVNGSLSQRAFESVMSKRRRVWGEELTAGAVGCFLSHAKAWERALRLNESILVLEDDVLLLSPAFEKFFPLALNDLPARFGLLYLGDMARDETIRKSPYSANLKRLSQPLWGMYAYVISPLAARRLLLHMYPADVQVDSYVQQVAALYDADMPNFVVSQDIVYTDNSETRDTDAQARGVEMTENDPPKKERLRYHVLLPSMESTGSKLSASVKDRQNNHMLEFDPSYSSSSSHEVWYHDETAALAHAIDIGILSPAQAASESGLRQQLRTHVWRWLLCLAVSMRHGGLCFAEPFMLVRSIQHLLYQVSFGVFLSSTSTANRTHIMPQVVYASSPMPLRAAAELKSALWDAIAKTNTRTSRAKDQHKGFFYHLRAAKSCRAITFPPHIFDPLLPLRRPCHCPRSPINDRVEANACHSRCKRLVAPPFAAGFPISGKAISPHVRPASAFLLHVTVPGPNLQVGIRDVAEDNLQLWKRLHASPMWSVHVIDSRTNSRFQQIDSTCRGLSAVARYGGVFVDSRFLPRKSLSSGPLQDWSMDLCGRGIRCHKAAPVVVALSQVNLADEHKSTASVRRPSVLSLRFFAAHDPHNLVANRLASACARALAEFQSCGGTCLNTENLIALQLQRVLADDACSVEFIPESEIFGEQRE